MVVGSALVVLLLIAGWSSPEPPPSSPDRPEIIDRGTIRIGSERKWAEKVVLDTSQPTIAPPAVEEPPAAQSGRLSPDDAGDQSNLEALAGLKPDTPSAAVDHPTLRIKRSLARTARSKRVARGPTARRPARAEAGWAVVSLDGSTIVKQGRMLCCASTPHRHGRWIGRRSPGGTEG
jgi:hypothetical protein